MNLSPADSGSSALEYSLIVGLIAAVLVLALAGLGHLLARSADTIIAPVRSGDVVVPPGPVGGATPQPGPTATCPSGPSSSSTVTPNPTPALRRCSA